MRRWGRPVKVPNRHPLPPSPARRRNPRKPPPRMRRWERPVKVRNRHPPPPSPARRRDLRKPPPRMRRWERPMKVPNRHPPPPSPARRRDLRKPPPRMRRWGRPVKVRNTAAAHLLAATGSSPACIVAAGTPREGHRRVRQKIMQRQSADRTIQGLRSKGETRF